MYRSSMYRNSHVPKTPYASDHTKIEETLAVYFPTQKRDITKYVNSPLALAFVSVTVPQH